MTQQPGQVRIPLSRLQLRHPVSLQVFEDYEQAQRAVDYLSDREFPVENLMIVGTDLKQVERVTGRVTSGKVITSGALSGAWMGMFFGSLMWLFVQGAGMAQFLTAVIIGALFGMIWAAMAYRVTGGARDFTSVSQVVATRYEVLVESEVVHDARRLVEDLRRGVGKDAGPLAPATPPPYGQQQGQYGAPGQPSPGGFAGATAPGPQPGFGADGAPVSAPPPPEPPKYRTYGEALDAERAARAEGVGSRSEEAAEDAHDAHDAQPQQQYGGGERPQS